MPYLLGYWSATTEGGPLGVDNKTAIALVTDITPNRGTIVRIIAGLEDLLESHDARNRYIRVAADAHIGDRIWYTPDDVIHDVGSAIGA